MVGGTRAPEDTIALPAADVTFAIDGEGRTDADADALNVDGTGTGQGTDGVEAGKAGWPDAEAAAEGGRAGHGTSSRAVCAAGALRLLEPFVLTAHCEGWF